MCEIIQIRVLRVVYFVIYLTSLSTIDARAGNITDIIENPIPQYRTSTCQSYSAAILLAFKNDVRFPIDTLQALRDAEIGIRQAIEARAKNRNHYDDKGNLDPRHDDIVSGLEDYTSGTYTLKLKSLPDISSLGTYVADQTGLNGTSTFPFPILVSAVKTPLMLSVTRIGQNNYKYGHLVAVLGVSGPPNSTRQYLIVNSAVKTGDGVRSFCDPNEPASQTKYGALSAWTNDVEFKDYGGAYYAFSVNEK